MTTFRILIFILILFSSSINATSNELQEFTVAAVQLKTIDAGNFNKMRELVKIAKTNGADLVVFPEDSVFS